MEPNLTFNSILWKYQGKGAWFFITLPKEITAEIQRLYPLKNKGWGIIQIRAIIGQTKWQTSLFPDTKSSSYLLPVKASVRKKEALNAGDWLDISLELGQAEERLPVLDRKPLRGITNSKVR